MRNSSEILLASSSDEYFKDIASYLFRKGFAVFSVSHGDELKLVYKKRQQINLMLFSTSLPGLTDLDILTRGRELYPGIPFFLLVFDINLNLLRLADLLQVEELIRLPIEMEDLEKLIIKYLKTEL